jgi:dTDP-glucose 4,6-dehydratase
MSTQARRPLHVPRVALITGGAGFIGTNFIAYALAEDPNLRVVNLDALTYAANPSASARIGAQFPGRYKFVHGNIADTALLKALFQSERFDTLVNFAAESHVDRSIDAPDSFIHTNIAGTYALLRVALDAWKGTADNRFHHVSTDEVFGSLGDLGYFSETTRYDPSSPYSASKAASDHLVRAWGRTYGLPVTITNCSNNYGPYQHPEKLIPHVIRRALNGESVPLYGDGLNVRDWLYVEDHCRALDLVIRFSEVGATYNIGGNSELANINLVQTLCSLLDEMVPLAHGSYCDQITHVPDRPGHDRRYAIDASKLRRDFDWSPSETAQSGLRKTVRWYLDNPEWYTYFETAGYDRRRLGATYAR